MRVAEELRTYLQVLWHYKWMIAACAIIASITVLGISLILKPIYSATTTMRAAASPGGAADYTYLYSATRLSNTYIEIATNDNSLNEVMKRLKLQKEPSVEVDIVPETELITISASDPNPALARDIANTLASIMVEQSMQLYGGNAPTAREILEKELQQAKVELDHAVSEYGSALRVYQSSETPSVNGTPMPHPDLETLSQLVSVRQQIYGDLLQRYENARTSELLRTNFITIVQPADLPQNPTTPKIPFNTALGLLGGLAMGVILAFLFEGMDNTLRGIEDVQGLTNFPILCRIPELKHEDRLPRNGNHPAPPFEQLRTRLVLFDARPKSTSFLITSPEPGAGKSTVASNLAVSLAQGGNKVVLVDLDFRHPHQHTLMRLSNKSGLSNLLCGEVKFETALQTTDNPDLYVITAGSIPNVPSEWLTPERIGCLLKNLGKKCDFLLIDAPALLSLADPMIFASQADKVIMVVARRKTKQQNLLYALQQLTELKANVAGIVLNKMPNSQLDSYYIRSNN